MSAADNQSPMRKRIFWSGLAIFTLGLVILDAFMIVANREWGLIYEPWPGASCGGFVLGLCLLVSGFRVSSAERPKVYRIIGVVIILFAIIHILLTLLLTLVLLSHLT